jgi:hypothetical protein
MNYSEQDLQMENNSCMNSKQNSKHKIKTEIRKERKEMDLPG